MSVSDRPLLQEPAPNSTAACFEQVERRWVQSSAFALCIPKAFRVRDALRRASTAFPWDGAALTTEFPGLDRASFTGWVGEKLPLGLARDGGCTWALHHQAGTVPHCPPMAGPPPPPFFTLTAGDQQRPCQTTVALITPMQTRPRLTTPIGHHGPMLTTPMGTIPIEMIPQGAICRFRHQLRLFTGPHSHPVHRHFVGPFGWSEFRRLVFPGVGFGFARHH